MGAPPGGAGGDDLHVAEAMEPREPGSKLRQALGARGPDRDVPGAGPAGGNSEAAGLEVVETRQERSLEGHVDPARELGRLPHFGQHTYGHASWGTLPRLLPPEEPFRRAEPHALEHSRGRELVRFAT